MAAWNSPKEISEPSSLSFNLLKKAVALLSMCCTTNDTVSSALDTVISAWVLPIPNVNAWFALNGFSIVNMNIVSVGIEREPPWKVTALGSSPLAHARTSRWVVASVGAPMLAYFVCTEATDTVVVVVVVVRRELAVVGGNFFWGERIPGHINNLNRASRLIYA